MYPQHSYSLLLKVNEKELEKEKSEVSFHFPPQNKKKQTTHERQTYGINEHCRVAEVFSQVTRNRRVNTSSEAEKSASYSENLAPFFLSTHIRNESKHDRHKRRIRQLEGRQRDNEK